MTRAAPQPKTIPIDRPRIADRLSPALRSAYGDMRSLPDDMVALLMEIDIRADERDPRAPRRHD
ncbi:hypothetical protein ACNI3Q_12165 [Sphingomonas sp. FW199]|uniref:hypothetical protein n=1 Tax=unclassified Sphingomonas TaxID=196159 RepID=UPI0021A452C4|nr:hypothetical protein [Sphingomonas sp. BGYR3]MDG5488123.1 hypothetical protein [Sphingomonas sp. BGYR3]